MGAALSPARRVALRVLSEVRRRDARARDLLRTSPEVEALDSRDKGFVERLVLGVVATRGVLDAQLKAYVSRPSSLEPRVRDALRLATYELLWLDTPVAAAVNQGVELVRVASPRAARLANAVLHKLAAEVRPEAARAREQLLSYAEQLMEAGSAPQAVAPSVQTLELASGIPAWLCQQVKLSVGPERAVLWAAAQLEAAPLWVSQDLGANLAPGAALELAEKLSSAGIMFQPSVLPYTYKLERASGLSQVGQVGRELVVSDFSARLIALIGTPEPGQSLLEVGQGRATKTVLIQNAARELGGPVRAVGVDSVAYKTSIARERLQELWPGCCESYTFDGCALAGPANTPEDVPLPEGLNQAFDVVFLDAPCSGTGTLRRHPEICWSTSLETVAPKGELAQLQLELLTAASARVAPGGALVYATCSVLAAENSQVVEAFLASKAGHGFRVQSPVEAPAVRAAAPEVQNAIAAELVGEYFQSVTSPGAHDGHFCARLVRE